MEVLFEGICFGEHLTMDCRLGLGEVWLVVVTLKEGCQCEP